MKNKPSQQNCRFCQKTTVKWYLLTEMPDGPKHIFREADWNKSGEIVRSLET